MSSNAQEFAVLVDEIPIARKAAGTIAVIGTPNSGKSTVFNRLTGMRQKTANYPGVTVERRSGRTEAGGVAIELVDLPGTYSLNPNSTDELIAVSVLFGRLKGMRAPDAVLAVIDSTRLFQGLYLVSQVVNLGCPVAVALTMTDAAEREGLALDLERLRERLGGVAVFPVVGTTGRGFDALKDGLAQLLDMPPPQPLDSWPGLAEAIRELGAVKSGDDALLHRLEVERLVIDGSAALAAIGTPLPAPAVIDQARAARDRICGDEPPIAVEARQRYAWVNRVVAEVQTKNSTLKQSHARLREWINRPWPSTLLFVLSMGIVFQAVFSWAEPFMNLIDGSMAALGGAVASLLPDGALASFIVDGVIAGVGSVIIFLPQILILFLFIILMEDTGYLARAAFLVDRAMRSVGLSGQSVIPLLSSFACAVPSIMATRVIPNRQDRVATIIAAPFMTCSARLPIYALMIAAFVPADRILFLNLQGIVLFGLYVIGILGGVGTALLLKRSALRGQNPAFVLALPEFRMPDVRSVAIKLLDRVRIFLRRAGTIIFAVAVIVWALAYFPRSDEVEAFQDAAITQAEASLAGDALAARVGEIENEAAAMHLAQSWLGRAGQVVEPVFAPLGWDWRVSAAVIAGFPAREVVVAVLGTIFALGAEAEEESLALRLTEATWPNGQLLFSLPMVLGLLLFYAWCLQCAATLAVIRRETNSWRWPIFAWAYMTALGYTGALLIYQLGSA
jgi:ferrous iron transport protein B